MNKFTRGFIHCLKWLYHFWCFFLAFAWISFWNLQVWRQDIGLCTFLFVLLLFDYHLGWWKINCSVVHFRLVFISTSSKLISINLWTKRVQIIRNADPLDEGKTKQSKAREDIKIIMRWCEQRTKQKRISQQTTRYSIPHRNRSDSTNKNHKEKKTTK